MCVGCRERTDKHELLRLVCAAGGRVEPDLSQTRPGRGAYLHRSSACLDLAVRRRALGRALRADVDTLAAAVAIREILGALA
jgi:predicted RNA-binding protein YlxR (DUF448 family)